MSAGNNSSKKTSEEGSERWKFTAMWTKQLQKKAKVWQDGHLIFSVNSKKLTLLNEEGSLLTSKIYPSIDVIKKFKLNEELKIGAYLITIESLPNSSDFGKVENDEANKGELINNQSNDKSTEEVTANLPVNNLKRKSNFNRPFVSPMLGNQKVPKLTTSVGSASSIGTKVTRNLVAMKPKVPGFTISPSVSYSPLSSPNDSRNQLGPNPNPTEYMEYLARLSIDLLQTVIEDFGKQLASNIREIQTSEVSKYNIKQDIIHPNFVLYQAQNFNLNCQYKAELSTFSTNNDLRELGIDLDDDDYNNRDNNVNRNSIINNYLTSSVFGTKIQGKLGGYAPRHLFSKDDLWILSKTLKFEYPTTCLLRSNGHGCPNKLIDLSPLGLEDELKFFEIRDSISESGQGYLIRGVNLSSDISQINNLIPLEMRVDYFESLLDTNLVKFISNPFNPSPIIGDEDEVEEEINEIDPDVSGISDFELNTRQSEITSELLNQYSMVYSENYNLNIDQGEVLQEFLQSTFLPSKHQQKAPIQLIHGVYGSGKSLLISIMIIAAIEISTTHNFPIKILLACMTNVAVDNILLKLKDLEFTKFCRVGSLKRINKQVLPFTAQNKKRQRDDIDEIKAMLNELDDSEDPEVEDQREVLEETLDRFQKGLNDGRVHLSPVVGATCLSTSQSCMEEVQFDVVIQDECSQLTEPLSLLSLIKFMPKNLVLVGDPNQLPPTINTSSSLNWVVNRLKTTLFDRFYNVGIKPKMLRTQYRCNPTISKLSNSLFYQNKLLDGVSHFERLPIHNNLPNLCFINVEGKETTYKTGNSSFYNELEISTINELITELRGIGVKLSDIGIISLYKNQVEKLNKVINIGDNSNNIQISTVDAFQGAEKNIIIVSCVRTFQTNFLTNVNRINVAITRAKSHLFIIGNGPKLKLIPLWRKLISGLPSDNGYFSNTDEFLNLFGSIPKVKQESNRGVKSHRFVKVGGVNKADFKLGSSLLDNANNPYSNYNNDEDDDDDQLNFDFNDDYSNTVNTRNISNTKVSTIEKTVTFAPDPIIPIEESDIGEENDDDSLELQINQIKKVTIRSNSSQEAINVNESELDEQLDELFDLL